MQTKQTVALLSIFSLLAACGGGGGGGGGGGDSSPSPAPSNLAPTVSVESLVVGSSDFRVTLSATASDPEGDALTYSWSQTLGTAVDDPANFDAPTMSFMHAGRNDTHPLVETLSFTVQVSDGRASRSATVNVLMLNDATRAAFVDGENGSDTTGDGSLAAPFASVRVAAETATDSDLYLRTLPFDAAYEEEGSNISLPRGRSIYGGFDGDWVRDVVDNKTRILTGSSGLRLSADSVDVEISGLDVTASSPAGVMSIDPEIDPINVTAVFVNGSDYRLRLQDNVFESQSAVPTTRINYSGSSIAVKVLGAADVTSVDNVIIAGNGSDATTAANPGGLASGSAHDGGSGGAGGDSANENGGTGQNGGGSIAGTCGIGGAGGSGSGSEGGNGSDGLDGCAYGSGGLNGEGGSGFGQRSGLSRNPGFVVSRGEPSFAGRRGGGGGGGGGGEAANGIGLDGGQGGTGGRGGRGGAAVPGSRSGGASIGVEVDDTRMLSMVDTYIRTGNGGIGGESAGRNAGEPGRPGSAGAKGVSGVFNDGGDGGDGGNGADGSSSGIAGAGGGGPSVAIMLGAVSDTRFTGNTFETGDGGRGGAPFIPPREPVGVPVTHGKGGFSVGIFHWEADTRFDDFSNNVFILGNAGAGGRPDSGIGTGVSADFANPQTPLPLD